MPIKAFNGDFKILEDLGEGTGQGAVAEGVEDVTGDGEELGSSVGHRGPPGSMIGRSDGSPSPKGP